MTETATQQRRDRAISRTREEILRAAASTIGTKGYRGTTMLEIASAAGYTPPTLYTYFDGKAAIYEALLRTVREDLFATVEEPMPSTLTFPQKLELVLWRQLDLCERRREAVRLYFAASASDSAQRAPRRTRNCDEWEARIVRWFRDHAPRHIASSADDAACVLLGIVHAFIRRSPSGRSRAGHLHELAPRLASLFLNGFNGTTAEVVKKKLAK